MNSQSSNISDNGIKPIDVVKKNLVGRRRAERRFRTMGIAAILASLLFLALLFVSIIGNGYSALFQTYINIDIFFDPGKIAKNDPSHGDYPGIVKASLRKMFPDAKDRKDKRSLYQLVSSGAAFQLRKMVLADPALIGQQRSIWVPADDDVDMLMKGHLRRQDDNQSGRFNRQQFQWLDRLEAEKRVRKKFNIVFFTAGDSREPELAGVWGAVAGSFFTLLVTLVLSFPIGVASAVYLEEFAPKNRWTDLIEVNINNLAAVPSIVFGLLGLAVFLNFFGLPRSAPLVGGLVLTLMTLPTIIIAGRGGRSGGTAVDS